MSEVAAVLAVIVCLAAGSAVALSGFAALFWWMSRW